MQPQRSLRKSLSGLGRLENAWADALAETGTERALERMRTVLTGFEERPEQSAPLWLSFQESCLQARFLPLLRVDDLQRLAGHGEQLAGAGGPGLELSWIPLARAVLSRGSGDDRAWALVLLARLYRAPQAGEEARLAAAVELTEARADNDSALDVYADLLGRHDRPPAALLGHVRRLFAADFDDPASRIERAAALAGRLATARPGSPGTDRVRGLAELVVHGRPMTAIRHFEDACRADPTDRDALHGLVAAHLQAGRHRQARQVVAGREPLLTMRTWQLLDLCRTLAWLDDEDATDVTDATDAT
ncbi:hypothetical protein GTW43_30215, partial [Streptomyces sp. SID5785]|uniref:tetratricopeptide repeat protein n=1 Tax=Streptomyces sp. SID5785 TaxID=2690309 RepID=UPI0013615E99